MSFYILGNISIESLQVWIRAAPDPRFQPQVDPQLEPPVCCNPHPNCGLYSLVTKLRGPPRVFRQCVVLYLANPTGPLKDTRRKVIIVLKRTFGCVLKDFMIIDMYMQLCHNECRSDPDINIGLHRLNMLNVHVAL